MSRNYWHDNLSEESGGVTGDSLADAVVFFLRMADVADLGNFVAAGIGRDTHLDVDRDKLAKFVAEGGGLKEKLRESAEPVAARQERQRDPQHEEMQRGRSRLNLASDLQVNVEIHIAADAKPATIEEIKNMRKYLLNQPDASANGE